MEHMMKLGGKAYRPITSSTLEHDHWVMGEIRGSGLDRIVKREDETTDEFVRRLLAECIQKGRVYSLLGGFIIPETVADHDWTPVIAGETADAMRKLTDPQEKQNVNSMVVDMLIGFFLQGLAIAMTSPSALTLAMGSGKSEKSAVPMTSATGADSSEHLPGTTRNAIRRFFAGLFGKR